MPAPITAIHEDIAAETRLNELTLDSATLARVILLGEYARAAATANDPLTAPGWDAFRYRLRAFRDSYCPRGWIKRPEGGLELTVSPCGRHAVITRGGNGGVGLRDGHPQPSGRIGDSTYGAVRMNEGLLDAGLLLDPNWMNVAAEIRTDKRTLDTRMLLVHRLGDIVRSELSLPSAVEETSTGTLVLGWVERILLPAIDLSTDPGRRHAEENSGMADVEPKIIRKR